jgi:acyl carrier protein
MTVEVAEVERTIGGIWSSELGVADIGPDEDFFELGGHSLHAVTITSHVERVLGVAVPLRDLYQAPTVRGHAARVVAALQDPSCGVSRSEEHA